MAHLELSLPAAGQVTALEPGRCYVLRLPAHATQAQAAQVSRDLRAALERLPPEQRPVVWLAQGGLRVEDVTAGRDAWQSAGTTGGGKGPAALAEADALGVGGPDDEAEAVEP